MLVTVHDITVHPPKLVLDAVPAFQVLVNPTCFIVKAPSGDRAFGHREFTLTATN